MKRLPLFIIAAALLLSCFGCLAGQNAAETPPASPETAATSNTPTLSLLPPSSPPPIPVDRTVKIDAFTIDGMTITAEELLFVSYYETFSLLPDAVSLTLRAEAVVVGEVLDVAYTDDDETARTYYSFSIEESWKGSLNPGDTITVLQDGGYVRGSENKVTQYNIHGMPLPAAGDRYLLFLNPYWNGIYAPCGDIMGRYFIDGPTADRRLTENVISLFPGDETEYDDPATLDGLKSLVAEVVKRPRAYSPEDPLKDHRDAFARQAGMFRDIPDMKVMAEDMNEFLLFYDGLVDKLQKIVQNQTYHPTMLFLSNESPLAVFNGNTLECSIMETAGGVNAARELANWYTRGTYGTTEVTIEQIIAWDPEVIYCPAGAVYAVSDILKDPAWQEIRAVRDGKVFQLPSRPRSRLAGCLEVAWIVSNLYPGQYTAEERSADAKRFYTFKYGL